MRRPVALAALLGAVSLLAAAREAAAWTPLDPSVPRWGEMPVGYYINRSTIPGGIADFAVARIESGFAAWSNPDCTEWRASLLGETSDRYNYNDGKNVFHWISSSWPAALGDVKSVIGVTMPAWGFNGVIVDADMVFNDVGFCWNDSGNGGCVDTQSIATHEEGHFLGLGHSNDNSATMAPFYGGGSSLRALDDDDIEGVCALYPADGTAAVSSGSGSEENACDSCFNGSLAETCKPRYDACSASVECRAFATCYSECLDNACADRCVNEHAEGAGIYLRILQCICDDCSAECSDECVGINDGSGGAGGGGGDSGAGGDGASSASGTGAGSATSGTGAGSVSGTGTGGGASGASIASSSSAGGESMVSSTVGVTVSSSAASGGGAGNNPPPLDTPPDGGSGGRVGCACSTSEQAPDLGGVAILGVLGALASRRRRR